MGLETVELVMAIEEEFGIEIRNEDAGRLTTVGEIYNFLLSRLEQTAPIDCLSQRVFYKLRRALIETYGLSRHVITPATKLDSLLTVEQISEGWPFLQMFIALKTPSFVVANEFLGMRLSERVLTVKELVDSLIQLNIESLVPERESGERTWHRLVDVIVNQTNVNRDEVVPSASITGDLGID